MITCLTGAMLVFETELQHVFFKHRYFVATNGKQLTTDSLVNNVLAKIPTSKISGIKIYSDATRTAEVSMILPVSKRKTELKVSAAKAVKPKGTESNRIIAFVNPYSGEVIEMYNHKKSFFYLVMDLHRWMLGGDVGKLIVGICTLIFLFILITGIILWWPKNKQLLQQRLKIKQDAGFKRLNHDYHVVLGFYSAIFLFVFAFTALSWSFEWFNKGIYIVTNSSMERLKAPKSIVRDSTKKISIEVALQIVLSKNKGAVYYNINLPKDSADSYTVNILSNEAAHETATDIYYIDAFTPEINGIQKFADKNQGQKIRATFRPIHVASIYGITSKIIGFATCLLGTFFPASGFICGSTEQEKRS